MLRTDGCLGLVATKTITQGDTREGGLQYIVASGGIIYSAKKRLKWSGEAAVTVSVVHIAKGSVCAQPMLDGKHVAAISCYLVEGTMNSSPAHLSETLYFSRDRRSTGRVSYLMITTRMQTRRP